MAAFGKRSAVIDIGTNSVKLLVAESTSRRLKTIAHRRSTTRAGKGLRETGRIADAPLRETIAAVGRFAGIARKYGCGEVTALATEAFRRAENGREAIARIARETGVTARILSGREEAELACLGAKAEIRKPRSHLFLIDIGGGSTEFVAVRRDEIVLARSLPVGALHLTERFVSSDPINRSEFGALTRFVDKHVSRTIRQAGGLPESLDFVASGGSATTVHGMLQSKRAIVWIGELESLLERCLDMSVAQRKRIPGLPADRADIIPAGMAILRSFMRHSNRRAARISAGGIRAGFLIASASER